MHSQPFATWLTSICCCFGGGTLVNLFCGKPPLGSILNTQVSGCRPIQYLCCANGTSRIIGFGCYSLKMILLAPVLSSKECLFIF